MGESRSPPQVIWDGFQRYKELVLLQIDTYKPDIVIVCFPEALKDVVDSLYKHCHSTDFNFGLPNVRIGGADVGIGKDFKPLFLWTHHPQAMVGANGKGITNEAYTKALLQAYDSAMCVEM